MREGRCVEAARIRRRRCKLESTGISGRGNGPESEPAPPASSAVLAPAGFVDPPNTNLKALTEGIHSREALELVREHLLQVAGEGGGAGRWWRAGCVPVCPCGRCVAPFYPPSHGSSKTGAARGDAGGCARHGCGAGQHRSTAVQTQGRLGGPSTQGPARCIGAVILHYSSAHPCSPL